MRRWVDLHNHEKRDAHAWMHQVIEIVVVVYVIDVAVVGVGPIGGPGFNKDESVAAIDEALLAAVDDRRPHGEGVGATELSTESIVGYVRAPAGGTRVSLFPTVLLRGSHLIARLLFLAFLFPLILSRGSVLIRAGFSLSGFSLPWCSLSWFRLSGFGLSGLLRPIFFLPRFLCECARGKKDEAEDEIRKPESSHGILQSYCS